ncbi:MAG: CBS domain-containing protein [Planctomycetes bacterium]|nr:CBS domain-containing protein [Planctomycetota bacterium]
MGLRENILRDPISELTLRPVVAMPRSATVRQTIEAMKRQGIGAAIIVDSDGRAAGMFNEKLLIRLLLESPGSLDEPVEKHMTPRLVTVRESDSIAKLLAIMQEFSLRWVCIIDEQGRPTALTGLRGLIEYVVDYFPRQVKVQPIDKNHVSMRTREGA